jgi:hypothetical protein
VGDTYDEGYGPKPKWPEGARRVSEGHVTIWKKIASECSGWCFVSEDDAKWPDLDMPDLPENGFVSFFKEAVCNAATKTFSHEYRRVVKDVVRGVCMPYGAVAYGMHSNFAKLLLDALPMKKPVDHFLWTQAVKHQMAFVADHYNVQHKKGKSLRESARSSSVSKSNFNDIQLLENEGDHAKFDKGWSKYNKFVTNQGFLKLGMDNIAHEYLYWNVAFLLGFEEIFFGKPTVRYDCKDIYALSSQLEHVPKSLSAPMYAILTPFSDSVKSGWDQTKNCKDLSDERVLKMLIVDYLVGHSDRPANCHTINGKVYAIDNDGVTLEKKLKHFTNNVQENILNEALKDMDQNEMILQFVVKNVKTKLSSRLLFRKMNIFNSCDDTMRKHIDTLVQSIVWRFDNLMSQANDMVSESSHIPPMKLLMSDAIPLKIKPLKSNPKIAIAIPTYNRMGYVRLCGAALRDTFPANDIYIFDDHSNKFNRENLKAWFLTDNIFINEKRLRPDAQARNIIEWFVQTDYDWLVTLDSDLIVRPDWQQILREHLDETDGVVSLYHSSNSNNHRTLSCNRDLCRMSSLGNAGIVWEKSLATQMLAKIKGSHSFDWNWSKWLKQKAVRQYAFENSLVLHIGMHGTWGADSMREKSLRFDMTKLRPSIYNLCTSYLGGRDPEYIPKEHNKYYISNVPHDEHSHQHSHSKMG